MHKLKLAYKKITSQMLVKICLEEYKQNNRFFDVAKFQEEYNRFSYVLRLIAIYCNGSSLNSRILINHMVILQNEFGSLCARILAQKAKEKHHKEVHTILEFMGLVPENNKIELFDGTTLNLRKIPIDENMRSLLEEEICRT